MNQYPWTVQILDSWSKVTCGGALISPKVVRNHQSILGILEGEVFNNVFLQFVLTTAKCVTDDNWKKLTDLKVAQIENILH